VFMAWLPPGGDPSHTSAGEGSVEVAALDRGNPDGVAPRGAAAPSRTGTGRAPRLPGPFQVLR